MPTVHGTIYKPNGDPVSQPQRMRWYKGGALIEDFKSAADGGYSTILAAGGYCIVIGPYAGDPPSCAVTTVPLQMQDFRKTTTPHECT